MLGNPMEIALLVGAAVLLFGAERLPKLARSAGEMRREFMRAQDEAMTKDAAAPEASPPATSGTSVVDSSVIPVAHTPTSEKQESPPPIEHPHAG